MLHSSAAKAGVWGMDPVLGITADYATNPVLLDLPHTAQTDAALLVDAPTTFNGDAFKLSVLPSFRVGDTRSYSSVNSNYEHLSLKGEYDSERSVLTGSAGVSRDSSLYQAYLANGEAAARRDGVTADLNWDRLLTERLEFNADANWMRVQYGQSEGEASLIDYKYTSVTPTLVWNTAERAKFTFSASAGQYDSLDGTTRSRNANLQIGFTRPLTELWSLTATGGYSRSLNRVDLVEYLVLTAGGVVIETVPNGLVLEATPVQLKSSQNGSVYSINLTRAGERLTFNAIASRQEVPTGFAFLSRQNNVELKANYSISTRWSVSADTRYTSSQDPQAEGPAVTRTVDYVGLNSYWRWTEHWTVTVGASRVGEHFQSSHTNLASNQIALTLSRQFTHINFQ